MTLASALTSAILPILTIAVVGYGLGRRFDIDVQPLSDVTLYVLIPALIFHSLATTRLSGETVAKIGIGVVAFILVMVGLAEAIGRAIGEPEPYLSAFVLASAFPNSGNYGIPLAAFAFGPDGRTTAVVFLTVQNLLVYTLGVYVASRGAGYAGTGAVKEVFRLPLVYAAVAALGARWLALVPPVDGPMMATVKLVGDASIPLMLLILGIQLARIDVGALSRVAVPSTLKLLVAPVVGAGVALLIRVGDVTAARVFVLECATPAAIIPLMLTIEYSDLEVADDVSAPEYLSTIVFFTTVASVLTLSVLIVVLEAGLIV